MHGAMPFGSGGSWKCLVTIKHDFASTLKFHVWGDRVRMLPLPYRGYAAHRIRDEVSILVTILKASRKERALLLNSSSGDFYPDVLACVLLGLLPRSVRPRIAIMGDMWEPNAGFRGALEKLVIKMADRAIDRYLVMSTEELTVFPRIWGVDGNKLRHCPYHYSVTEAELAEGDECEGNYVFAGGDSARDYAPLIEAARRFPDLTFILATEWKSPSPLPPNVQLGRVPHRDFIRLMRNARIVVVPIKQGLRRSVGQQTYLNSMYMRRPTVVADGFGVRDHIDDGKDALITDGTASGYIEALDWLLAPENAEKVKTMTENAHWKARFFSPERMAESLHGEMVAMLQAESAHTLSSTKDLSVES